MNSRTLITLLIVAGAFALALAYGPQHLLWAAVVASEINIPLTSTLNRTPRRRPRIAEYPSEWQIVTKLAGVSQVETATVVGTIDVAGAGNAKVVVTGARIVGSPLTVLFAVANNDTASQVAGKARTALGLVAAITNFYTVSGATDKIILTETLPRANDATLNIATDNDTSTGLVAAPASANTTAGSGDVSNVFTFSKLKTVFAAEYYDATGALVAAATSVSGNTATFTNTLGAGTAGVVVAIGNNK